MTTMTDAVVLEFPKAKIYDWDARVGRVIKKLLIDRDMTQGELAAKVGMKQPELSKRCKGKTQFKGSELAQIADALGVTALDLYTLDYGSEGSVIEVDFTGRRTA